jgi:ligand-binding sensor domain-containing protein
LNRKSLLRYIFAKGFCTFIFSVNLLFVFFNSLNGQSFPFREYSVADGLPQSQAREIYQDSRGFLWIVTRSGISRFDGIEFKNYFRHDGLPSNIILKIIEDSSGHIYALSEHGLAGYNGYSFEFYPFSEKLSGERLLFAEYINDTILILTKDHSTNRCRIFNFKEGIYTVNPEISEFTDTLGIKILFYDKTEKDFIVVDESDRLYRQKGKNSIHCPGPRVRSIYYDRDEIVIEAPDGQYILEGNEFQPLAAGTGRSRVEVIRIRTGEGDILRHFSDGYVTEIKPPDYSKILLDNESNLWLGTEVNLHRLVSTAFYSYGQQDGLPSDTWAVAEDANGYMWFGSLTGDLFQLVEGRFVNRNEYRKLFSDDPAFFKGSIRASDGKVYFSLNEGVLVWDGKSFSRLPGIPDVAQVCILYEDPSDKSIFAGTGNGLYHFNGGKTIAYPASENGFSVIEGILRDDEGKLWLTGEKGIFTFDGNTFTPFRDTLVADGNNYTMVKDSRGGIWFTSEEGLFFREKNAQGLRHGLPENINTAANSIILMDENQILTGRMKDICIIDLDAFYDGDPSYFRIYDKDYGFYGSECLDNGLVKDREGSYWILTAGKVIVFDPRKLRINRKGPKVHITDVEYETDSTGWQSLEIPSLFYHLEGAVKIKPEYNNLKIKFTGISFANPEKVMYQHRLEGSRNVWSAKDYAREVIYRDLKPGHYNFQVKAFNADGFESEETYSMKFTILPSFRETWAFRITASILSVIIVAFMTLLFTKKRLRKKNEEMNLRSQLSRLQMNSVINQFDPHFTFNVISSVGSLIMKGEKDTAYNYILKLSGLLRSMHSDGSIMLRPVSDEIDFVRKYLELQELRFKDRLKWKIEVDENADLRRLIPKMTLQIFAENSVRHGIENRIEGGRIVISAGRGNGKILLKITDNGIGRKASRLNSTGRTGSGIKTINRIFDFMNRINGEKAIIEITDLYEKNGKSLGTEVLITIPDDYSFEPGA